MKFLIWCSRYHGDCIKISEKDAKLIKQYFCVRCHEEDSTLKTKWKTKREREESSSQPSEEKKAKKRKDRYEDDPDVPHYREEKSKSN